MAGTEREPTPAIRPASGADAADLAVFLSRVVRLDPAGLVRVRSGGDRLTAYVRLPFGVLVSRSAGGHVSGSAAGHGAPADVTVGAADLLAALDRAPVGEPVALPPVRDAAWRGALPPAADWQRLDAVPVAVVRQIVRAGGEALRSAGPAGGTAGEALLYQDALTVSGAGRTVVLPLRVLSAASRMGFLGPAAAPATGTEQIVVVSAAGTWARLAAAYGSAYHRSAPGLGVLSG
jgi:hypothetical protein